MIPEHPHRVAVSLASPPQDALYSAKQRKWTGAHPRSMWPARESDNFAGLVCPQKGRCKKDCRL